MREIINPVLPGFNPDPSILRVGKNFYIATSTFEWFPGVQIHHSRDLVHWRLLTRLLTRISQLDMIGNPDSGGIWAPCLSHDGERFYLIYTDTKAWMGPLQVNHNYLVTSESIEGPWSEPVYLNSSGFDPSLFHDDDGRKWLVNVFWDHTPGANPFAGILLQEYDPRQQRLVGPRHNIFQGARLGCTEGAHLYKRNGMYYLLTAEGGTSYEHAVTVARSEKLEGPYETDPRNPVLTSLGTDAELQKAGHASLVELEDGSCYLAHLCGRPVGEHRRCILGRETALQKVVWTDDGWLGLEGGGNTPQVQVPAPDLEPHPFDPPPEREDFDDPDLPLCFQSLRVPMDASWLSLTERPGWLRLYGRESTVSRHRQSLVARRIDAFDCEATTELEFEPDDVQQAAGLIALYDVTLHYYLGVTRNAADVKCLRLLALDRGEYAEMAPVEIPVPAGKRIGLKAVCSRENLQFAYNVDGGAWMDAGPALDLTRLSDDYRNGFTGAFLGLCAQDMSGRMRHADFDWFAYRRG